MSGSATVTSESTNIVTLIIKFDGDGAARQKPEILSSLKCASYRMKILTEFNLATWLRIANFMELKFSKF